MKVKCGVYRCSRKADTYLYLKTGLKIDELPEGLLTLLGELTQFLNLALDDGSKLAQVDASEVIAALEHQGYFIQMPPAEELAKQAPESGYVQ